MTEGDLYKAEQTKLKELTERASSKLLYTVLDIQTSLDIKAKEESPKSPEAEILTVVTDALSSFMDAGPVHRITFPRKIREEDKTKLLPGQHSGITTVFSIEDGNILRINVYGGLRTPVEQDMRDSDITLKKLHTTRTDKVLSQNTQVGWQIETPEGELLCDVWIVYRLNQNFRLDTLKYEGETIGISTSFDRDGYGFETLNSSFNESISNLLRLIPSSR